MHRLKLFFTLVFTTVLYCSGCRWLARKEVRLPDLLARLHDPVALARLDLPDTHLIASTDPRGGNDDFNHYLRPGPPGWWVLADLKGPGYVSRFWFTGGEPTHRIRLFFDNEKTPRIDASIGEFCGGMEPFRPPLAAYENLCYYNYVPLTYKKRLVIMAAAGATRADGWPRLFYQINYTRLPRGHTTASFSMPPTGETLQAIHAVRTAWQMNAGEVPAGSENGGLLRTNWNAIAAPAAVWRSPVCVGPAVIRELKFSALSSDGNSICLKPDDLRDITLRIYWDESNCPSVTAPLDVFLGSMWRYARYAGWFFGASGKDWHVRLPMPFARTARLELENQSDQHFSAAIACVWQPLAEWDGRYGYLHVAWRRSLPAETGRPHTILETAGRGRFAGCLLGAVSYDNSFWLLEGDELMWRDNAPQPYWAGTGLEDYFNGGWYYQNVMVRPLHGLPWKNFFRTVQYRIHLPDAVNFKQAFRMIFERGPDHGSRGLMESLAWYYLDAPQAAPSLPPPYDRQPPDDPLVKINLMRALLNYESFGDYAGALDFLEKFLADYPDIPYADLLRLRRTAYQAHIAGVADLRPQLAEFLALPPDAPARRQAQLLLDFLNAPNSALLGFNANMPARVFLDGKVVLENAAADKLSVCRVDLQKGRHVLAVQCRHQPYPDWMQLCLRTHAGDVYTTPQWRHAINPSGAWWELAYDDNRWVPVGGTGCKGPPEEPYLFLEPNGFLDMQARAVALRPSLEWPDKKGTVVYRHVFEVGE